jgi:hypothetical protein
VTNGQRGRSGPVVTHALLAESVTQTEQMIEAWFDEFDYDDYADAYRKIALSGTTGAFEALAKQQVGSSTSPGDPVDVARFLADAWLSSVANAFDATRDVSREYLNDLSRYLGLDLRSEPKRAPAKKSTKGAAKKTTKRAAKKTTKGTAKKTAAKTATPRR